MSESWVTYVIVNSCRSLPVVLMPYSLFNFQSLLCWVIRIERQAPHNHLHFLTSFTVQTQTNPCVRYSTIKQYFNSSRFVLIMIVLTCSVQLSAPSSCQWEHLRRCVCKAGESPRFLLVWTPARVWPQEKPSNPQIFWSGPSLAEASHRWRTVVPRRDRVAKQLELLQFLELW